MNDTLVRLQRAIDLVEANLFDDLPLASMAGAASCSPWHFHRLFTALTGETPAGYVRKRRLGFSLYSVLIDVGPSSTATLADLSDRVTSVSQLTDAAARDLFVSL